MANVRRWFRAVGYTCIGSGGIASLIWPPLKATSDLSPTSGPVLFLWAILVAVGGLTSALGSASDIWLGEYAGLWPLIITFFVFGLTNAVSGNLVELALSLVILGWACLLAARWREVAIVRSEALRFSRYQQRRTGG
jgi:hypothetical protein